MDIKITDYAKAEEIAKRIGRIAQQMQTTFSDLDYDMNQLHGEAWQSNPSSQAYDRYTQFKTAFTKFYEEATRFCNVIIDVIDKWQKENAAASNKESAIMDQVKPV